MSFVWREGIWNLVGCSSINVRLNIEFPQAALGIETEHVTAITTCDLTYAVGKAGIGSVETTVGKPGMVAALFVGRMSNEGFSKAIYV